MHNFKKMEGTEAANPAAGKENSETLLKRSYELRGLGEKHLANEQ